MRRLALALLLPLALETPVFASDGVLEINQTCAVNTGCFAGDTAGFPVTITTPGTSYRLTSSLTVPNENTSGIVVNSSSVSIDLSGFEIVRLGCEGATSNCTPTTGTGSGVYSASRGISVRNGSITGMGSYGVRLTDQAEVKNLRVRWNRLTGIIAGLGSIVSENTAHENGGIGISIGIAATISGNMVYNNGSQGISAGYSSTVSGNTAFSQASDGIYAGSGSNVSGNTTLQNGGDGISVLDGSTVSGNTAYDNGDATSPTLDDGIQCTGSCIVRGNSVRANSGYGLNLGADSAYSDNLVTLNATGTVTGAGSANGRGGNYCAGTGAVSANCP